MKKKFKQWPHKPAIRQQYAMLESWFGSERGQRLLNREMALVEPTLTQSFGYHLLQLSVDSRVELFRASRVQRKFRCHPFTASADALCDSEQLPFASESLDVVILHHVQEFADDPHRLLREVERVVVPHGQVLIFGFNPWSPLGLSSRAKRAFSSSHWHSHQISCRRMKDWLGLLGFDILQVEYGMRIPAKLPGRNSALVDAVWRRWPFGDFYLISAVKQVVTFTPIRPKWSARANGFSALSPVKTRPVGNNPVAGKNQVALARQGAGEGAGGTLRRVLKSRKEVA